jgi:chemotaxis protein methyltransferase CheR
VTAGVFGEPGELTAADFQRVANLVRTVSGIHLPAGKESLVRARLAGRVRTLGLASYGAYVDLLARDSTGAEMDFAIDLLTTNKTSFFREPRHFELLGELLRATTRKTLRIWCAAASTGEEPYTLAMTLAAAGMVPPHCDSKILATDICRHALATAETATYRRETAASVPGELAARYLEPAGDLVKVKRSVRDLVTFARLNLMDRWPMRGPFEFIFCRNVMIYFDDRTRERLVDRMRSLLAPSGYLMIGHAESLSALRHQYTYHSPAVYRR